MLYNQIKHAAAFHTKSNYFVLNKDMLYRQNKCMIWAGGRILQREDMNVVADKCES